MRVARTQTNKGRHTPPNNRSANAIFITRNKLFLAGRFLLNAKRKIVSKFPAVITTASDQERISFRRMTTTPSDDLCFRKDFGHS